MRKYKKATCDFANTKDGVYSIYGWKEDCDTGDLAAIVDMNKENVTYMDPDAASDEVVQDFVYGMLFSEIYNILWNLEGIADQKCTTFARCTTYKKAKKAKEILEKEGFEGKLRITHDRLPVNVMNINGNNFCITD